MTPVAITLDEAAAIGLAALAATWLGWRAVRTLSARKGGGCACPSAGSCGPKGPTRADLSAAAARATSRVAGAAGEAGGPRVNPKGAPDAR